MKTSLLPTFHAQLLKLKLAMRKIHLFVSSANYLVFRELMRKHNKTILAQLCDKRKKRYNIYEVL